MKSEIAKSQRYFAVLNRNLFLRSLAAFKTLTGSDSPSFADPLTFAAGDSLLLVRGGISSAWSDCIGSSREGEFPVLLELNLLGLDAFFEGTKLWGLLPCSIPLTQVKEAFFPGENQLKEFVSRSYDDVIGDIVPIRSDSRIFRYEVSAPPADEEASDLFPSKGKSVSLDATLAEISDQANAHKIPINDKWDDAVAGGLCCLLQMLPQGASWHHQIVPIIVKEPLKGKSNSISNDLLSSFVNLLAPEHADATKHQIYCAIQVFLSNSSKEGWQSTQVLTDIAKKMINADSEFAIDKDMIHHWMELSVDVLENRSDCDPLPDEGEVALRAILLACLRKKPEAVSSATNSYLRAGEMVTAIAGFLCGLSSGMANLSKEIKLFNSSPKMAALMVRNLLLPKLWESGLAIPPEAISIKNKLNNDLSTIFEIRKGKEVTYSARIPARAVYQQLVAMGRQMDLPLCGDKESGYLMFTHEWKSGRKQSVYIKSLQSKKYREDMVRFISPFERLPKIFKNPDSNDLFGIASKSRSKAINRDGLIKYLLWQSKEDKHCRIAIDAQLGCLCVIVDQIVSTMDREELSSHLMHVAEMADQLEEDLGTDIF
ncbi:hypothetical protein N8656_00145 [bacterium]|nr:hypothetical protein [bacterium]